MFSGIVETVGIIVSLNALQDCVHITIRPHLLFDDLHIGDSVAVNGVCLTVTAFDAEQFSAVIVPETLRLTNLEQLALGSHVNLERSLQTNARIGGHHVQGHVDQRCRITALSTDGDAALMARIAVPETLTKYIVKKGYVTIDGMSITVVEAGMDFFTVTFIPHTQAVSVVKHYQVGTDVNIEVDIMGKYIEKLLGAQHASPH